MSFLVFGVSPLCLLLRPAYCPSRLSPSVPAICLFLALLLFSLSLCEFVVLCLLPSTPYLAGTRSLLDLSPLLLQTWSNQAHLFVICWCAGQYCKQTFSLCLGIELIVVVKPSLISESVCLFLLQRLLTCPLFCADVLAFISVWVFQTGMGLDFLVCDEKWSIMVIASWSACTESKPSDFAWALDELL